MIGDLYRFEIRGDGSQLLTDLFSTQEERLRFGLGGWCDKEGVILSEWTRFHDYLMEGAVTYEVRTHTHGHGLLLEVRTTGSRRDEYVGNQVRWVLATAGVDFEELP